MTKRLSEDARRLVLNSAAEEARRRGDRRLGTDHLLVGLLYDPTGDPARALGVDLVSARAAYEELDRAALAAVGIEAARVPLASDTQSSARRPLTSGARAVFKRAIEKARPMETGRIETQHFLLALLDCERPDPAAELLQALGVNPSVVRARLADRENGVGR